MNVNFAKYSSFIDLKSDFDIATDDYRLRYGEAKSVLDLIAQTRREHTATLNTANDPLTSAPTISSAPNAPLLTAVPTLPKLLSVVGAAAMSHPSMTADGLSRVQTKIPFSIPATTVATSTYPNVLPLTTVQLPTMTSSLPTFVTLGTGATRKVDPNKTFFTPQTSAPMTSIRGATVVTSLTFTRTSVLPNVNSADFQTQQNKNLPHVENIGSDKAEDFRDDPRFNRNPPPKRGGGKRGGQQSQQQRPPPFQQNQSNQFTDYQKQFDSLKKQIEDQKRQIEEHKKKKVNFEEDLILKLKHEMEAENARKGKGEFARTEPNPSGPSLNSNPSRPSQTSAPSREQPKSSSKS